MKKSRCIILSFFLMITLLPAKVSAAALPDLNTGAAYLQNTTVVYRDNDIVIECSLIIGQNDPAGIQPFAAAKTLRL